MYCNRHPRWWTEGQFVCYELNRRIEEHLEYLKGIVEIYPALNPLGVNSITRGVPGFDLDMNRVFPGSEESSCRNTQRIRSWRIWKVLLLHWYPCQQYFPQEIPQVRVSAEMAENFFHMQKTEYRFYLDQFGSYCSGIYAGSQLKWCGSTYIGSRNGSRHAHYQRFRPSINRGHLFIVKRIRCMGWRNKGTMHTGFISKPESMFYQCG